MMLQTEYNELVKKIKNINTTILVMQLKRLTITQKINGI